jgi:SNF family Na+-dependent transporter
LALCLLLAWIIVYFCIWKGVKSVGKVVYVTATFPYVVLLILLIRGATLPGSLRGVIFYLRPDFQKLADPAVWVRAAGQIFYSLGVGFGSLVAMGSYNKFNNNCYRDAVMVSSINCGTSVLCGFVVFSLLGHMSDVLDMPIEEVAKSGPGLAFIVYPAGIAQMPVSTLWAILFFLMLITLGLDSQFAFIEVVVSSLSDEYPKYLRKYKELFILCMCVVAFLLGIPTVLQSGAYIVEIFNTQAGGLSLLFLAFFESLAIGWIYGADRLLDNVETMIGYRPSRWWLLCWKYFSPTIIFATFMYGIADWSGIIFGDYKYPAWAEGVGWLLAFSSMICIPIGMGFTIYQAFTKVEYEISGDKSSRWRQILQYVLSPNEEKIQEIESKRVKGSKDHLAIDA